MWTTAESSTFSAFCWRQSLGPEIMRQTVISSSPLHFWSLCSNLKVIKIWPIKFFQAWKTHTAKSNTDFAGIIWFTLNILERLMFDSFVLKCNSVKTTRRSFFFFPSYTSIYLWLLFFVFYTELFHGLKWNFVQTFMIIKSESQGVLRENHTDTERSWKENY